MHAEDAHDDRLLELARRLLDGEVIDWEKEDVAEAEVREGMKRLERIIGRADRFIGGFRLVRTLGEGGMGVVYEAEQQHPKRLVALKVIHGGAHVSRDKLKLFQREIQTLARLSHPAIAQLYEAGVTDDGMHFFAMELVPGVPLADWLRSRPDGPTTPGEMRLRLEVFRKICDAVAYAHQKGVIHRDLKPGNILVTELEVKVLDFGLARITDSDVQATISVTEVGKVQGTLPYMSPEQVRGNPDEIDFRSDVYALGVILYQMVSGRLPYDIPKAQIREAIRIICEESPRSLSASFTGTRRLDADVATIAGKCLEKATARRYQSAAALGEDIQRFLTDQPILARPPSAAYQIRKLIVRHKGPFAAATAAIVLLAVFAAAMTVQAVRIGRERDRADLEADVATAVSGSLAVATLRGSPQNAMNVKGFIDDAANSLWWRFRQQPLVYAHALVKLGLLCREIGLNERADMLFKIAASRFESVYGRESLEYAGALGQCWGVDEQTESFALYSRLLTPDDPRVAKSLHSMAVAQLRLGRPEAEANLRRARSLAESSNQSDKQLLRQIQNDLALALFAKRDYHQAAALMRQLQPSAAQLPLPLHPRGDLIFQLKSEPERIAELNNLGRTLMLAGERTEARYFLETAFYAATRSPGLDGVLVARCAQSLGELERLGGDTVRARSLLASSFDILESKNLVAPQPGLSDTLMSLGLLDESEGRLDAARDHLRRACECFRIARTFTSLDPCPDYDRLLHPTEPSLTGSGSRRASRSQVHSDE